MRSLQELNEQNLHSLKRASQSSQKSLSLLMWEKQRSSKGEELQVTPGFSET